jgi:hypothetical protein
LTKNSKTAGTNASNEQMKDKTVKPKIHATK